MASTDAINGDRAAKRRKLGFMRDIVVLVGEDETRFVVHKSLACKSSDFFETAFAREWKESNQGVIRLPEIKSETFAIYAGWLYTDEVEVLDTSEKEGFFTDTQQQRHELQIKLQRPLLDCYVLGDMVQDRAFRNVIIDEFLKNARKRKIFFAPDSINYVWNRVPRQCKLLELLGDCYATACSTSVFEKHPQHLPSGFISDIARSGIRDRHENSKDRRLRFRTSYYHEHRGQSEQCQD